jgi:trehalose/maltose hydrolase-like predicted phosphorylase
LPSTNTSRSKKMLEETRDTSGANWMLAYESFEPEEEGLREALTSTGNGYFCTRGALAWAEADGVSYPGTYTHGGYNRETTIMAGVPVLNEDLVNLPNWLLFELRIEGEEAVDMSNVELLSYRHEYDARYALLRRITRFRDRAGRETTLDTRRFVSMADMHQAAMEWTITPENWSGNVEVITALDGRVTNRGVARYRRLEGRHLDPVSPRTFGPEVIALVARTRQSRIYVAEAARTRVYRGDEQIEANCSLYQMQDYIHQVHSFEVSEKVPVRVEKMVSFYTSRDHAINEPLGSAGRAVGYYPTFTEAFERHVQAWDELWDLCDVRVPKDDRVQLLLRVHISHILQVCSPHTADLDTGVPARGLNGEAYRGHIFWDELYIYPFLNFRLPEITRELLMYRYRRLDEARRAAKDAGYKGAMFPWQSGSDGTEETQVVHLNPKSGKWEPDLSHNQRHVSAAIFYNIWRYYEATGDFEFLLDYGAEMMLEIARFWSTIAHFNPDRGRYEIHGVMGPDEFHEKYPGSDEEGLRNNAYTNVLVAWICETIQEVLNLLPERLRRSLSTRLELTDEEIVTWREMSHKMFVPFHDDGIISQFEGYESLEELDWDAYREKYGNIQRLDRILRAEGDDPDRYKLAKQADTVLLFFLFPEEELKRTFERLGYDYAPDTAEKNVAYYDQRTSHGSTLSFVAHAGILADLDPESSWARYMAALESDVGDVQGGTTQEGIHMGVMAGTLDLIQRSYMGSEIRDGVLCFNPKPVGNLDGLSFLMRFRGMPLEVRLEGDELTVAAQSDGFSQPIKVGVGNQIQEIKAGERHTFAL